MTELDLQADGSHRYLATTTTADGTAREHTVLCDEELLAELGLGRTEEPLLVRRALETMLRAAGEDGELPAVIDLRALGEERPELLDALRQRTAL
ncbi:hypothetical protein [Kineococcus glutinatus]|uniref:Uncharacterized protein n=1 Tax=Kineococcus glutinatus TaxID=1070872 RepID=A0ABP8VF90_9ACTN